MLAALVLASWCAQAEPAPGEHPPAPVVETPAPGLDKQVTVYAGYVHRLGSEGTNPGPADGLSLAGNFGRRYFATPAGLDLVVGIEFYRDQFESGALDTTITQTGLALVQTVGWRWRRLHPFAQIGAGFTVAYVSVPGGSLDAEQPLARAAAGCDVSITPKVGVSLRAGYALLLTRPTLTAQVTTATAATTYSALGDLLDVDVGVALRF